MLKIGSGGKPSFGAVMTSTANGDSYWDNDRQSDSHILMYSPGLSTSATATGYVYTPKSPQPSFTFHLYQNRSTNTLGTNLCTFGGYVVEDL